MKRFDEPILVTRPYLPPLDEFQAGCREIWANRWLTNVGLPLDDVRAIAQDVLKIVDGANAV